MVKMKMIIMTIIMVTVNESISTIKSIKYKIFNCFCVGLEFVYTEAPKELQGVLMGTFLLTVGLGTYLGAAVVAIVNAISGAKNSSNRWYPDKNYVNQGKLAYYFFLLAGLMFLNFILYIFVARGYESSRTTLFDRNVLRIEDTDSNTNRRHGWHRGPT